MVDNYLKEMGVPAKYADLMFSIPKDQIRWIEKAAFDSDFKGDIPQLKDWLDARCIRFRLTDVEQSVLESVGDKTDAQLTEAEKPISKMLWTKFEQKVQCEWDNRESSFARNVPVAVEIGEQASIASGR
jgi:hypothetical protein